MSPDDIRRLEQLLAGWPPTFQNVKITNGSRVYIDAENLPDEVLEVLAETPKLLAEIKRLKDHLSSIYTTHETEGDCGTTAVLLEEFAP